MNEKIYNKLVRDNIPNITKNNGGIPITRILSEEEYKEKLNEKLQEEVNEYLESEEIKEIADIVEVLYAILDLKGVPIEEFESIRKDKLKKRGGFKERILLEKVIEE